MKKIKEYLDSLDNDVLVNEKLLFFEFVASFLGGLVLGFLLSPKKNIKIGNNNGNKGVENETDPA